MAATRRTQCYPSILCDAHMLDTLMDRATRSPSNCIRSWSRSLVGRRIQLTLFDWDADLTRTAWQHRHRTPFLDFSAHQSAHPPGTEICGCPRLLRSPQGWLPPSEGWTAPTPFWELDGLPHRARHDRPADVWIPHEKDMVPEAWDFAATSCLRPATRNPAPRRP